MTHQQLYPSKRPCNKCGGIISWDIATRERLNTKLPLNIDGTVHDKASCDLVKAEHPGLPTSTSYTTTSTETASPTISTRTNNTTAERTEAIQKAHEENMDSSERLRRSLDNLAEKIDKFSLIVSDTISAYLAMEKKAE